MKRIFAMSLVGALAAAGLFLRAAGQAPDQAASPSILNIFYMGNRASRLESCGCHSRQQGGVQYEAVIYDQNAGAPSLRVDLGNWTITGINQRPVDLMLTRYVLRALAMMQADAVNLGLSDIELTATYLDEFKAKFAAQTPPFISANVYLKSQPDKPAFAPYRIVSKQLGGTTVTVGITGVCWLFDEDHTAARGVLDPAQQETIDYVARKPLPALEPVIAELRPKVDLLVVLSSGEAGSATEIARAFPKVDLVISRNASGAPQTSAQQEGTVKLLFSRNNQGKELGRATLERKDGNWVFNKPPEWLAVNKDVEPKAEYVALIEEFKAETKTLKPVKPPKGVREVYAGDIACKRCHEKEGAQYDKTRHAHALQTLVAKGQQFNPNCVKCHVTGFQESNGFYSIDHTPSEKMANVQCEMCHGPGLAHFNYQFRKLAGGADEAGLKLLAAEEAKMPVRKQVPEKVCVSCHTPENDDTFDYQKKMPLVKH